MKRVLLLLALVICAFSLRKQHPRDPEPTLLEEESLHPVDPLPPSEHKFIKDQARPRPTLIDEESLHPVDPLPPSELKDLHRPTLIDEESLHPVDPLPPSEHIFIKDQARPVEKSLHPVDPLPPTKFRNNLVSDEITTKIPTTHIPTQNQSNVARSNVEYFQTDSSTMLIHSLNESVLEDSDE